MSTLLKIEFGSNGRKMDGWICTDLPDVDIRMPLKWDNNSACYIYLSHVLEHVASDDAMRFMKEAYRVLAPGGILRVVVPEISTDLAPEHIYDLCTGHGHLQTFSTLNLMAMFYAAGFLKDRIYHDHRQEIDVHWKTIGDAKDLVESLHMEAVKDK